jgi:hypothetical protein
MIIKYSAVTVSQSVIHLNNQTTDPDRNIYILSGMSSQAAIKALRKYWITSKLVWDCHQSRMQLAKYNRLQLIWLPGLVGTDGKETADQLAKLRSQRPFIGPERVGVARKAVKEWTKITANNGIP